MKKFLCCVLIVVMVLSMTACATKLSGTYKSEGEYLTYKFSGNDVTMNLKIWALDFEMKGTYKIEDDKITFTWEEDNAGLTAAISAMEKIDLLKDFAKVLKGGSFDFEKTKGGIKIAGLELTKQ